jgi:cytoskeletal protein RodZ
MESIGKYLKKWRELRNLSLDEAAQFTKIKKQFLEAIEEDKYELLPPAIYVKGYLTAYARYLGLDPNDAVLRYQKYLKELTISKEKPLEEQKPEPQKQVLFPSKMAMLCFFLAALSTTTLFTLFFINQIPQVSFHPVFFHQKEATLAPVTSVPQIREWGRFQTEVFEQKKMEGEDSTVSDSPIFKVTEAEIGTVVKREGNHLTLKGKCREFTCNDQKIYFLTRIKTPEGGRITHVWIWKGKEYHRNEIEVKAPEWSVYSYLTLRSHRSGDWKVEVRAGEKVLASLSFNVIEYKENLFEI